MSGKVITLIGIGLVLVGLALTYAPWLVNWFGKLPGDINIKNEKNVVYFPVVSMLVISIVLSIIVNLLFKK